MRSPRQLIASLRPVVSSESMTALPVTLSEVLQKHELIDVQYDGQGVPVVIVGSAPPPSGFELVERAQGVQLADANTPDLRELGAMGSSIYYNLMRQDYNPKMRAPQSYKIYDEMRRSDAGIRSSLRALKTPILSARWFIQPAKQSNGDVRPKDQMIADFVWNNLTKWMSITWEQVLFEAMLQFDFGFYMFEKVFEYRMWHGKEVLYWKKLAPRHPMDVIQWEYTNTDGGPKRAWMYDPFNAQGTPIDIEKLLVFTFDKEGGDMSGISVLRSAYMHWYYKNNLYKIDAIQKERHGIGIPIIKLPIGYQDDDKRLAHEIGRNLRTNERAHVVLPPNWDLIFAPLGGHPVDAIASIEHHDNAIRANILAGFLKGEGAGDTQDLFMKSVRFAVENVRGVFNKFCIPQLVNYNWANIEEYPELKARRVGDHLDWRAISFAIRNFVGAGILVPDDALEEWVRDEMDMPASDPDTIRVIPGAPPQAPQVGNRGAPTPGLPRQSPAGGMRQQAQGVGKSNTGQDNSGG